MGKGTKSLSKTIDIEIKYIKASSLGVLIDVSQHQYCPKIMLFIYDMLHSNLNVILSYHILDYETIGSLKIKCFSI